MADENQNDMEYQIPTMESIKNSQISEWYRDKTIFITGGTGFMGKVLIEKLLRSCPIKRIYLLVREKRGRSKQQRVDDMFENYRLFDKLKAVRPEFLKKVLPVQGDITHSDLGLSAENQETLRNEVNIIYHCAATINFEEPLPVAIEMNMMGTKRVVALAKQMKNIEAMVHVSTAYANCHLQETYEELYPAPIKPDRLINMVDWLKDKPDVVSSMTSDLVSPRPNTYTFTKAVAEHILVEDAGDTVPYAIIRPSIVCGAWREPEPGWVDNMYAFTGLLVGMGKGLLRTLYIKPGIKLDFIPVDVPINLMIVAAYNTATKSCIPKTGVPIYCCSTGYQNPLTIEGLNEYLKETVRAIPQEYPYWFPDGSAKSNKTLHVIHMYATNVIPAYLCDFVCKMLNKKQIAVKLCNRMMKAVGALEYFMLRDWTFHNENTQGLWRSLSPGDRQMYHFNVGDMDWGRYVDRYQRGVKKFILKEGTSDEDIERCIKKMKWLNWLNKIIQFGLMYCAYLLLSSDISVACLSAVFNEFIKMMSIPVFGSMTPVLEGDDSMSPADEPVMLDDGLSYEL